MQHEMLCYSKSSEHLKEHCSKRKADILLNTSTIFGKYQRVGAKLDKQASIIQSPMDFLMDSASLKTPCFDTRRIPSSRTESSCTQTRSKDDSEYKSQIDMDSALSESFALRKRMNDSKSTCEEQQLQHTQIDSWSVTPKSIFTRDIDCTLDFTKPLTSLITPSRLTGYKPRKKEIIQKFVQKQSWYNPVLGVDIQDTLPSVIDHQKKKTLSQSNFQKIYDSVSFTKDVSLNQVHVIGQVEKQFVACVMRDSAMKETLVLVDQHAAHERIRLEKLLKQIGFYRKETPSMSAIKHAVCRLMPPAEVVFYENEIDLLLHFTEEFGEVGFRFSVLRRKQSSPRIKVYVSSIPSVFVNVCQHQVEAKGAQVNETLIKEFVLEQAKLLRSGAGKCNISSPVIFKVLASYACHGAIKFGDPLEKKACIKLIDELSKCQLPFQCAHGRPSIIPLLRLDTISSIYKKSETSLKPRLSALRKRMGISDAVPSSFDAS